MSIRQIQVSLSISNCIIYSVNTYDLSTPASTAKSIVDLVSSDQSGDQLTTIDVAMVDMIQYLMAAALMAEDRSAWHVLGHVITDLRMITSTQIDLVLLSNVALLSYAHADKVHVLGICDILYNVCDGDDTDSY